MAPQQQPLQETSKKAAKKEAAKAEKLRRRQEAAASASGVACVSIDGPDPLASNYGDVQSKEVSGRVWTAVSSLTFELKDHTVLVRGRAQAIRAVGKKMVFLTVEERGYSVQCVLTVAPSVVSPQMVKYATAISKESFVDIEGIVTVPPEPIKGASQQVEVQVRRIHCTMQPPNKEASSNSSSDVSIREIRPQKIKIVIGNNHGENLVGVLHETGSKDVVILCHGFLSTKESKTMVNLASALEKEGISAFRFDFAGNGESEGSLHYGDYGREADDLNSVIQHFHGNNRVTRAILGHSKGGNVVLMYTSKYHDVCHVINVSGRYRTEGGVEERLGEGFLQKVKESGFIDVKSKTGEVLYRVTEESLMDRLNTNMHVACLQIDKDCKVLTVHGSDDSIVRVEEALEFAKVIL